jgi:hypothetical protein
MGDTTSRFLRVRERSVKDEKRDDMIRKKKVSNSDGRWPGAVSPKPAGWFNYHPKPEVCS